MFVLDQIHSWNMTYIVVTHMLCGGDVKIVQIPSPTKTLNCGNVHKCNVRVLNVELFHFRSQKMQTSTSTLDPAKRPTRFLRCRLVQNNTQFYSILPIRKWPKIFPGRCFWEVLEHFGPQVLSVFLQDLKHKLNHLAIDLARGMTSC